jgi:hypothetical protein
MDEGWTRFVLEQYGFEPRTLDNKTIKAGKLRTSFDAIVLPDVAKEVGGGAEREDTDMILAGAAAGLRAASPRTALVAPQDFVAGGGALIAMSSATAIDRAVRAAGERAAGAKGDSPRNTAASRWRPTIGHLPPVASSPSSDEALASTPRSPGRSSSAGCWPATLPRRATSCLRLAARRGSAEPPRRRGGDRLGAGNQQPFPAAAPRPDAGHLLFRWERLHWSTANRSQGGPAHQREQLAQVGDP